MTHNPPTLSKRLIASLTARSESLKWERLIAALLKRLELDEGERADAEKTYHALGNNIARKLNIPRVDVDIFPQGSMRTQTTISPRGNAKFDLDIVVKLSGPMYGSPDSEKFFSAFGAALSGNESFTGVPEEKRRCWRLWYPGKPFYFDVTPAVADKDRTTGAHLKVRDPDTLWAPSNPEEYATWFCERADLRFPFQQVGRNSMFEARGTVTPLPSEDVGLDDILRRAVQLMKLHRDNMYWYADKKRKNGMPISVIIVTLTTQAFEEIWQTRQGEFRSPIEVVLAVVEAMPSYIERRNGAVWVANPKLHLENFADRWNTDEGVRAQEFERWHQQLETDLEALLNQTPSTATEDKVRSVFGGVGVEAWKASQPRVSVLDSLLASSAGHVKVNPTSPTSPGSRGTLG